jgi:Prokaryotic N-terminal methylation motif
VTGNVPTVSCRPRPRENLARDRCDDDRGFGLAEVLVASAIMMIIIVSFSNIMIDSLTAALLSRQREAAASIASDVIENASGLAQATGWTSAVGSCVSQPPTPPAAAGGTGGIPVFLAPQYLQCPFTATIDRTAFLVTPSVAGTTPLFVVTVTVTWPTAHSYSTSSQVST